MKRAFDLIFSLLALFFTLPFIVLVLFWVYIEEPSLSPVFTQKRVGRHGVLFTIYKIRTMRKSSDDSTVTVCNDRRITRLGYYLRKYKIDELPSFVNVLKGEMSVVGPRPDVPGFADILEGDNRLILKLRPGLTGPASVFFGDEEYLLSRCEDPIKYNKEVLFPQKTALNLDYYYNATLITDIRIIYRTFFRIYGKIEK